MAGRGYRIPREKRQTANSVASGVLRERGQLSAGWVVTLPGGEHVSSRRDVIHAPVGAARVADLRLWETGQNSGRIYRHPRHAARRVPRRACVADRRPHFLHALVGGNLLRS
jgi:hypothetical protein